MQQAQIVLKRLGLDTTYKISGKEIILHNGSRIVFKGMAFENRKRRDEAFKGITSVLPLAAVIFDELAALDDPSRLNVIMDTHKRDSPQFIAIFNPPRNQTSWLIDWRDSKRDLDPNAATLHTTIYDLADTGWAFVKDALAAAEQARMENEIDWQHRYLGLPVGGDGLAYNILPEDILIDDETVTNTNYSKFIVFGDIGNADATFKILAGVHSEGIHVLRCYNRDGRLESYWPHSKQADAYMDWLDELGIYPSEEYFDNLNYTLEIQSRRPRNAAVYNIKDKPRHKVYSTSKEAINGGFVKIYNSEENQILIQQIQNANLETVTRQGKDVDIIKKVDNRITPLEKQIHGLDALNYMIYYNYNKEKYGN